MVAVQLTDGVIYVILINIGNYYRSSALGEYARSFETDPTRATGYHNGLSGEIETTQFTDLHILSKS